MREKPSFKPVKMQQLITAIVQVQVEVKFILPNKQIHVEISTSESSAEKTTTPVSAQKLSKSRLLRKNYEESEIWGSISDPEGYRFVDVKLLNKALLEAHVCNGGQFAQNSFKFTIFMYFDKQTVMEKVYLLFKSHYLM